MRVLRDVPTVTVLAFVVGCRQEPESVRGDATPDASPEDAHADERPRTPSPGDTLSSRHAARSVTDAAKVRTSAASSVALPVARAALGTRAPSARSPSPGMPGCSMTFSRRRRRSRPGRRCSPPCRTLASVPTSSRTLPRCPRRRERARRGRSRPSCRRRRPRRCGRVPRQWVTTGTTGPESGARSRSGTSLRLSRRRRAGTPRWWRIRRRERPSTLRLASPRGCSSAVSRDHGSCASLRTATSSSSRATSAASACFAHATAQSNQRETRSSRPGSTGPSVSRSSPPATARSGSTSQTVSPSFASATSPVTSSRPAHPR
jgi:hypothetical protein